jgi:hypothetical protein
VSARPDLARLAERAALGALLMNPEPLTEIRRWLRPGDFVDPWHGEVFTTLLERHTAGQPIDPVAVGDAMTERVGARRANLPRLAWMISASPHTHTNLHARLVLDGGLRREIGGLGVLLRAAALQSATDHTAGPLMAACTLVEAGIDTAVVRWASATGSPQETVDVPVALRAASRDVLYARLGAARYLEAHPARDLDAERQRQVDLVGTLIAQPQHIPQVAQWLPASRIADPGWREVYRTVCGLATAAEPVDLVTVAWAVHRSERRGPALPSLDDLTVTVETGWNTYPPKLIADVACDQVRDLADTGAVRLYRLANRPTASVEAVVATGRELTATLRSTAAALPATAPTTTTSPTLPVERIEAIAR